MVAILLGATLSRVVVGASPALPTVAASLVIVVVHRVLACACVHSPKLERIIVGAERKVFAEGAFDDAQMSAALITKTDVLETARQELHTTELDDVKAAILERNGQVSLILKNQR